MEHLARTVFVTLVGSKYAAVVAGGQNVSWLLEQSQALTTARQEIPRDHRDALLKALTACSETYRRRNRVVHDAWARRPGAVTVTLRSRRGNAGMTVTARAAGDLEALADDLGAVAGELGAAATAALGDECLQLENQLRLEQGHDIGVDAGSS